MSEPEVLFDRIGHAGVMTLNRPKALNALNHGMVLAMADQLERWAGDDAVRHVIVRGTGDRAFCAGGDIRKIYDQGMAGDPTRARFFADEYRLNVRIKRFPKPYIALIDGIVMGGGVGVSVHGSHRVGTERTTFAMPETGIGFFPDVGGSWFLPRMPQETGMMAALSAGRLKQADALWTGILTHGIASTDMEALASALTETDAVDEVIAGFSRRHDAGAAPIAARAPRIAEIFGRASVAEILEALDELAGAAGDPDADWAQGLADTIRAKSPTSVMLAFQQLRRGAELDFEACMRLEYRILSHILQGADFYEGVRAVIVDKDNAPRWSPTHLADVTEADILAHFERPESGDLDV
ncbi:enoyl-CoA hydratase/isomerase family protein [Stappia sp. P2PMeth1]|uniref:enoyl-CoA hydratase/isomerase family protein n=1 Tax=Stappia sp. P2PMeth1 TaxID=2003586 RepID=UPI001647799E|nr:enoyl-CoA hydratase/isomerase family protein [Stappia sp. P2PMeth1]